MDIETFFVLCDKALRPMLNEHNLLLYDKSGGARYYCVVYNNNTTAVKVILDYDYQYIFVDLCKVVNGRILDNPVIISNESIISCVTLDDILGTKGCGKKIAPIPFGDIFDEESIERMLNVICNCLVDCAGDVLSGDFAIFKRIEKIIKGRK